MKKLIIRLGINAIALYVAVALLNGRGITPQSENWLSFVWLALIFGLVNAIIKPMLVIMSCPLLILTLGLGTLDRDPFSSGIHRGKFLGWISRCTDCQCCEFCADRII